MNRAGWSITAWLLMVTPAVALTTSTQQGCGALQQVSTAAEKQSGAVTQTAMSRFFKPQPSVSIEGCLRNLMRQTGSLGLYGLNIGSILTELENEACAASQGEVSNITSRAAQNINIPGAQIGGPNSPFYVPGAGASANLNQGYNGAPPVTLNGSPAHKAPSSWLQNLMN